MTTKNQENNVPKYSDILKKPEPSLFIKTVLQDNNNSQIINDSYKFILNDCDYWSFLSSLIPSILICGLILFCFLDTNYRKIVIAFLMAAFVCYGLNYGVAKIIKYFIKDKNITKIPSKNTKKCFIVNFGEDMELPSSYAQFITFFCIFWLMHFISSQEENKIKNLSVSIILLFGIIFLMIERINSQCNTTKQLATGSFIGLIFGAISFTTIKLIFKKK